MPQFSVIPERKNILEKIPDYMVSISPLTGRVIVTHEGSPIADSTDAILVQESRHADVYYIPRDDVDLARFTATEHSTYCPFKGHASYWSLQTSGGVEENIVWSYVDPYEEVLGLKDYLSFYPNRVEIDVSAA